MGPLIPNGIIPIEWNNIIAIIIGLAFGFILEGSGFSSSKKVVGVFFGYDFAVLKVFLTATIVSIIGILYMDYLGYINITQLYVHPTFIWGAIIGGVIMGIGFVSAGFCPGTSICAVAIGKIDAMYYILGVFIGIFLFSQVAVYINPIYGIQSFGNITLNETLNISPYLLTLIFTIAAILIFIVIDKIQKRKINLLKGKNNG